MVCASTRRDASTRRGDFHWYQTEDEAHCPISHLIHVTVNKLCKFRELHLGFYNKFREGLTYLFINIEVDLGR